MYDSSNLDFQIEHVDLNLCTHLVCIDKCWNDAEGEYYLIGFLFRSKICDLFMKVVLGKFVDLYNSLYYFDRIFSFVNIQEPWRVDDPHRGADYEQLTGLRAKYPHLKVIFSN